MTKTQEDALGKLLALRKLTFETNTVTRRSQGRILQTLGDADLIVVSAELARHQEAFGW